MKVTCKERVKQIAQEYHNVKTVAHITLLKVSIDFVEMATQ